jgi:hypothetical protein
MVTKRQFLAYVEVQGVSKIVTICAANITEARRKLLAFYPIVLEVKA